MVKIISRLTLIVFTLGPVYSYAEYAQVRTDQAGNVDKAGAQEDADTSQMYRDYYSGVAPQKSLAADNRTIVTSAGTIPQAVQAGVAFRGAIEANRATADGIAQARAAYVRGATPELDADGNPGRCYKYSSSSTVGGASGKLDIVPCNADSLRQTGSQDAGPQYDTATKGMESTTPSTNVGMVLQNRPYTPPPKP